MGIVVAAALLSLASPPEATAQSTKNPPARRYESGPLGPADFAARPPATRGPTNAYTFTSIDYSYRFRSQATFSGVRLVATELSAHATVKPDQSWNLMPDDARLMDHEQGTSTSRSCILCGGDDMLNN
jgi:hypothetical protein